MLQATLVASTNAGTMLACGVVVLQQQSTDEEKNMLSWAITFLVIALIAGVLGFGGIMSTSAGIAKILFVIFIILFIVSLIANAMRGRPVA